MIMRNHQGIDVTLMGFHSFESFQFLAGAISSLNWK